VVLGHAAVHGWVKFAINAFYKDFYDLLQTSGSALVTGNATALAAKRSEVRAELVEFCKIAAIAVVVMPMAKLVRSLWTFSWRMALTRAYLDKWNTQRTAIEGTAQRVQEDAARFGRGVEICATVGLDALLTLAIFVPILLELGSGVPCPSVARAFEQWGDAWLVGVAITTAIVGLGVTLLVGHRLVGLEVANQKVEASFRTDLVLLETDPHRVTGVREHQLDSESPVLIETLPVLPRFVSTLRDLKTNYYSLYFNFTALNFWLALFEQFASILPYLLVAEQLFAETAPIKLGTLVQTSNAFDKVFGSLNVVADNWTGINEFRSVVRRLRQFELHLYDDPTRPSSPRTTRTRRVRGRQIPFATAEVSMACDQFDDEPVAARQPTERL
jgi:peptide/bleomycin uptake transporter